jgi:hypothetical protein
LRFGVRKSRAKSLICLNDSISDAMIVDLPLNGVRPYGDRIAGWWTVTRNVSSLA